MNNWCLWFLTD